MTEEEQLALVTLKEKGWVHEYIQLETFPDLFVYMTKANLKVGCCCLVVLTNQQFELSQHHGFQSKTGSIPMYPTGHLRRIVIEVFFQNIPYLKTMRHSIRISRELQSLDLILIPYYL